ncbi:MAG: tat (twin-arginine translocation) pathway signal sequence [Spirochaetes bacterium GWD1_27_9]|nr:MAG: tat (twin-arginine translocation) pathway signal sequence [Spirochaetes bacterium GWD1_27_9]
MDRREFIKKSIALVLGAGLTTFFGGAEKIFSEDNDSNIIPDLVAIKDGEADAMFDAGIKAMGGMEKFVKKGQTVVVKPNIGWNVTPERAGNTNPKLIGRIVSHCLEAGAKKVYVFDNSCDYWNYTYKNSGISDAVKLAGGTIAPGNTESYYQEVRIPKASILKKTKVHELILDCDVLINVPILKHHSSSKLTIAMKNLMGVVWDRGFYHQTDLHKTIAEFCLYRKPDLNIVDAYYVLQKNGPRGVSPDDVALVKNQLISTDIVAIDAAAAKIFGVEPNTIPYIKMAHDLKIGNMNLSQLKIKKISV